MIEELVMVMVLSCLKNKYSGQLSAPNLLWYLFCRAQNARHIGGKSKTITKPFFRCCSLGSDLHILALLKIRTIFNQSYIGVHKYHFCLSMLLSDLKGERSGLYHQVTQRVEPSQVKICIHTQIVIPFFCICFYFVGMLSYIEVAFKQPCFASLNQPIHFTPGQKDPK